MPSFLGILRQPQNKSVASKLSRYTLLMFTLPICGFYTALHAMKTYTTLSEPQTIMYSGFLSVLLANVVICSYVVMAFREEEPMLQPGEALIPAVKVGRGKERED